MTLCSHWLQLCRRVCSARVPPVTRRAFASFAARTRRLQDRSVVAFQFRWLIVLMPLMLELLELLELLERLERLEMLLAASDATSAFKPSVAGRMS
jgi:hypothetical protein